MSITSKTVSQDGESVVWAVEVCNTGGFNCYNAQLAFSIPVDVTLLSADVTSANNNVATGAYNPTSNTWFIGTLNKSIGGSPTCATIVMTFRVDDIRSTPLTVTATATTSCDESSLADNSWQLIIYEEAPECFTNLELTTTTPVITSSIMKVDDLVCIELTAKNDSNFIIEDIEVSIPAIAGLSYSAADSTLPSGTSFGSNKWTIGTLAAAQSKTTEICYLVTDDTLNPFTIVASITSITEGFCDTDDTDNEVEIEASGYSCEDIRECSRRKKVVKVYANYVADGTEDYIQVYPDDNTVQVTVPDPTTVSGVGYAYPVYVKAVHLDYAVTIVSAGTGATIDEAPSYVFSNPGESVQLLPDYDDNDWQIY